MQNLATLDAVGGGGCARKRVTAGESVLNSHLDSVNVSF